MINPTPSRKNGQDIDHGDGKGTVSVARGIGGGGAKSNGREVALRSGKATPPLERSMASAVEPGMRKGAQERLGSGASGLTRALTRLGGELVNVGRATPMVLGRGWLSSHTFSRGIRGGGAHVATGTPVRRRGGAGDRWGSCDSLSGELAASEKPSAPSSLGSGYSNSNNSYDDERWNRNQLGDKVHLDKTLGNTDIVVSSSSSSSSSSSTSFAASEPFPTTTHAVAHAGGGVCGWERRGPAVNIRTASLRKHNDGTARRVVVKNEEGEERPAVSTPCRAERATDGGHPQSTSEEEEMEEDEKRGGEFHCPSPTDASRGDNDTLNHNDHVTVACGADIEEEEGGVSVLPAEYVEDKGRRGDGDVELTGSHVGKTAAEAAVGNDDASYGNRAAPLSPPALAADRWLTLEVSIPRLQNTANTLSGSCKGSTPEPAPSTSPMSPPTSMETCKDQVTVAGGARSSAACDLPNEEPSRDGEQWQQGNAAGGWNEEITCETSIADQGRAQPLPIHAAIDQPDNRAARKESTAGGGEGARVPEQDGIGGMSMHSGLSTLAVCRMDTSGDGGGGSNNPGGAQVDGDMLIAADVSDGREVIEPENADTPRNVDRVEQTLWQQQQQQQEQGKEKKDTIAKAGAGAATARTVPPLHATSEDAQQDRRAGVGATTAVEGRGFEQGSTVTDDAPQASEDPRSIKGVISTAAETMAPPPALASDSVQKTVDAAGAAAAATPTVSSTTPAGQPPPMETASESASDAAGQAAVADDKKELAMPKSESLVDVQVGPAGEKVYSLKKGIGPRRGKWSRLEEEYAKRIISDFDDGLLDAEPGVGLRQLLASKLQCEVMRVSKKFCGWASVGKRAFRPVHNLNGDATRAQASLVALEQRWLKTFVPTPGVAIITPGSAPAASSSSSSSSRSSSSPTSGSSSRSKSLMSLVPIPPSVVLRSGGGGGGGGSSGAAALPAPPRLENTSSHHQTPALQWLARAENALASNASGDVMDTLVVEGQRYIRESNGTEAGPGQSGEENAKEEEVQVLEVTRAGREAMQHRGGVRLRDGNNDRRLRDILHHASRRFFGDALPLGGRPATFDSHQRGSQRWVESVADEVLRRAGHGDKITKESLPRSHGGGDATTAAAEDRSKPHSSTCYSGEQQRNSSVLRSRPLVQRWHHHRPRAQRSWSPSHDGGRGRRNGDDRVSPEVVNLEHVQRQHVQQPSHHTDAADDQHRPLRVETILTQPSPRPAPAAKQDQHPAVRWASSQACDGLERGGGPGGGMPVRSTEQPHEEYENDSRHRRRTSEPSYPVYSKKSRYDSGTEAAPMNSRGKSEEESGGQGDNGAEGGLSVGAHQRLPPETVHDGWGHQRNPKRSFSPCTITRRDEPEAFPRDGGPDDHGRERYAVGAQRGDGGTVYPSRTPPSSPPARTTVRHPESLPASCKHAARGGGSGGPYGASHSSHSSNIPRGSRGHGHGGEGRQPRAFRLNQPASLPPHLRVDNDSSAFFPGDSRTVPPPPPTVALAATVSGRGSRKARAGSSDVPIPASPRSSRGVAIGRSNIHDTEYAGQHHGHYDHRHQQRQQHGQWQQEAIEEPRGEWVVQDVQERPVKSRRITAGAGAGVAAAAGPFRHHYRHRNEADHHHDRDKYSPVERRWARKDPADAKIDDGVAKATVADAELRRRPEEGNGDSNARAVSRAGDGILKSRETGRWASSFLLPPGGEIVMPTEGHVVLRVEPRRSQ